MSIPPVAFPVAFDDIPAEANKLAEFIRGKRAEIEIASKMLTMVRDGCEHKGAARGYNERDGSWMASCPHCGASK